VSVAADINPLYAKELERAQRQGLEVIAYGTMLSPEEIALQRRLIFKGPAESLP